MENRQSKRRMKDSANMAMTIEKGVLSLSELHKSVQADDLRNLSVLFLATLHDESKSVTARSPKGEEWGAGRQLGPLRHLIAQDGNWRRDWLAMSRHVLEVALVGYSSSDHRLNKGITPVEQEGDLRRHLGIDKYSTQLRAGSAAGSRNTVGDWTKKLFKSISAQNLVQTEIDQLFSSCDGSCWLLEALPIWQPRWSDSWWFREDEEAELLAQVRQQLGSALKTEDNRTSLLRFLLRHTVATRLVDYFSDNEQKAIDIWRTVHQSVFPNWYREEVFGVAPDITADNKSKSENTYVDKIGVVTSMFAWTVALDLDNRQSIRRSYEEFGRTRSTEDTWRTLVGLIPSNIGGLVLSAGSDFAVTRLVRARGLTDLSVRATSADGALSARKPKAGSDFLDLAKEIRRESDIELKRCLIGQYIEWRYSCEPIGQGDQRQIALADHLIHWDTVVAELTDLNLEMAYLIESGNPMEAGLGYRTHRFRSLAIGANKRNATAEANNWIDKGIRELLSIPQLPEIEWRESVHQHALAAAGIRVRYLEYLLRVVPAGTKSARIGAEVHYALSFSGFATSQLKALAFDGLPADLETARSQGRIATSSWHTQTRIIRFRAALGARTAIMTKLCGSEIFEDLFDDSKQLVYDDGYLVATYRSLIGLPELTTAHQVELCRLALWFAFLRGMQLPLSASVSKVVAELLFLDADPRHIVNGQAERRLDPYEVTEWLDLRPEGREDAGWLSWTQPSSAAARYLNLASESRYREWRANETARCRGIRPSHD